MADALDCQNPPDVITADPDIVGPGVLAAFFVTATVTILAVVFAYLSNTLDGSYMNDLDRMIIAHSQRKWRHLKRVHTNLSDKTHDEQEALRDLRRETVTQFILTLSDQQLVTGLAILIAGVSDPFHITGYEFTVVLALAWFSSTTHLTTLTALRKYMDSHGVIRDARVIGMVIVLILLSYSLVISIPAARRTVPVACEFESDAFAIFGDSLSVLGLVAVAMVLFMLVSGYSKSKRYNQSVLETYTNCFQSFAYRTCISITGIPRTSRPCWPGRSWVTIRAQCLAKSISRHASRSKESRNC